MTSTATPAVPAPTSNPRSAGRPRRYVLAFAVMLIGVIAAIAWTAIGLVDTVNRPDGFARSTIPGTTSVNVDLDTTSLIYYEGRANPQSQPLGLRVTGPGGAPVPVTPYTGDLRYDHAGLVATAIASFDASQPGRYRITTSATAERGAHIAVGKDLANATVTVLARGGLLALAALAVGALLIATRKRKVAT